MSAQEETSAMSALGVRPPDALKGVVAVRDGVLYVANDYITRPAVIEFEMKMRRMNVVQSKRGVGMGDLQSMINDVERRDQLGRRDEAVERRKAFALLTQGVEMSASDIHFLIKATHTEVKFRVDGYLDTYAELSKSEGIQLVSALYVAADANSKSQNQFTFNAPIAARITRDAESAALMPASLYAVRFASMKTDQGGLVVLRLLYDSVSSRSAGDVKKINLEDLGFTKEQSDALRDMANAPNGMIIIDGPTGSGKSTTLKYTMQWIHEQYPHFNILTVEDPPEYPIVGASQIPVSVQESDSEEAGGSRGAAYASIVATTLRLDPDILMVGEIRDGHSSIAALRAAETGHRLWSTLHANDAWEAMNRLLDLLREGGMHEPLPVLANTQNLCGMLAQRLVPKLCPHCKKPLVGNESRLNELVLNELLEAVPNLDFSSIYVRGDGCDVCVPIAKGDPEKQKADKRHGILGRTVVAEIVRPDQTLLDIARRDGIPAARRYWLKHRNGKVIADAAIVKIQQGLIDPSVARDFVGPLITARQILGSLEADQVGLMA